MPILDIDMLRPRFYPEDPQPLEQLKAANMTAHGPKLLAQDRRLNPFEQHHVEKLEGLHQALPDIHATRSLDHYFHKDFTFEDVYALNCDQVISRYLYHATRVLNRKEPSVSTGAHTMTVDEKRRGLRVRGWMQKLVSFFKTMGRYPSSPKSTVFHGSSVVETQACEAVGLDGGSTSTVYDTAGPQPSRAQVKAEHMGDTREDQNQQQILVVPQLWLWKIDSKSMIYPKGTPPLYNETERSCGRIWTVS